MTKSLQDERLIAVPWGLGDAYASVRRNTYPYDVSSIRVSLAYSLLIQDDK